MDAASAPANEFSELVDAYWEHYRLSTSSERAERLSADSTRWAVDEVDAIASDDDRAVPLMVALADAADDAQALAYLGAGPIEDVVLAGSPAVVDRIEGAAERSERFRYALRCAWFDGHIPPAVSVRLRRFGPAD
jgi:hypothetical protein